MRFQSRKYSCGAVAIVNALKSFKKNVSEKKVMKFAGTTKKDGTSIGGIKQALNHYGFMVEEHASKTWGEAISFIAPHLDMIGPIIIDCMNGSHWVTVVAKTGNCSYVVIDGNKTKKNKLENGVRIMTESELLDFWCDRRNNTNTYLALAVSKE